jgi:NADH-ubiquinone oxidoreductase chain 2
MWAPNVYEGSPTLVTAFFSIAPKISILANMVRVFIYSFYDPTWQQLSIGHVGYLFIGFSCGTIEGIQSLLIGVFIYVLMTINVFVIVLALRKNR